MERAARAAGISSDTEAADEGTDMHRANNPCVPLDGYTEEQRRQIEKARRYIADKLVGAQSIIYEHTMTLWDDEGAIHFGSVDVIGQYPDLVRIPDTKYGRSLMSAWAGEPQMRAYAAMGMQFYGVPKAEVFVYQPREDTDFVAAYNHPEKIAADIRRAIRACEAPDAPLNPSPDACLYCLGKTLCPEFHEEVLTLPTTRPALEALAPERVARALDFARLVEPWAKQVRDYARKLAVGGVEIPGWKVAERTTRRITDVNEAFDAVSDLLGQGKFLELVEVPIGGLEDYYAREWVRVNQGAVTLKEGIARFRERMDGCIETTTQKYLKKE
jgi:hypothetical protein